jgi:TonB family protein
MLPQSDFESSPPAALQAVVAIAAITQDRALIGLLRSTVDPAHDLILVTNEEELRPHLNRRRVSACLLDSMFIEGDLASLAERLRESWPDLVLVVVGTAEEQSRVASQITSGVVYRFLHRPVSAPRVRLFVEAALRRHEVENVERTLEFVRPDFSAMEEAKPREARGGRIPLAGIATAVVALAGAGAWFALSSGSDESATAQVVSSTDERTAAPPATAPASAPVAAPEVPAPEDLPAVTPEPQSSVPAPSAESAPAHAVAVAAEKPEQTVAERSMDAPGASVIRLPAETAAQTSTPAPALTHEQRLRDQLAQAEAALQRGELAAPPGRNAVELFRGALELDPTNTLAKAGLVRVADRLLSAAERALTAGNPEDARRMVDVAETLTPATARGAFLQMQIEMEKERAALTRARDADAIDKQERGTTYLRLANTRLRSGALIEPAEDNARFYLEAARQVVPGDPAVAETERELRRELLGRASAAATAGDAVETERWLANADGAGAPRNEMAAIRRSLQDTMINTRARKVDALAQSFTAALSANALVQPAERSAKAYLLELLDTDSGNPVVATARNNLGSALLKEMRGSIARDDLAAAGRWLEEARSIGIMGGDVEAAARELENARVAAEQRSVVVGANSLQRIEYVAPKVPATLFNRNVTGWVEVEFTVRTDGSTGDIVVTNSSPRRTFDASATEAISQWRYKPVMRGGKAVEQRAAVRIRFSE